MKDEIYDWDRKPQEFLLLRWIVQITSPKIDDNFCCSLSYKALTIINGGRCGNHSEISHSIIKIPLWNRSSKQIQIHLNPHYFQLFFFRVHRIIINCIFIKEISFSSIKKKNNFFYIDIEIKKHQTNCVNKIQKLNHA